MASNVVNAMTAAKVPKRNTEVILVANNVTFIDNETELESLLQPFQAMRHGVSSPTCLEEEEV